MGIFDRSNNEQLMMNTSLKKAQDKLASVMNIDFDRHVDALNGLVKRTMNFPNITLEKLKLIRSTQDWISFSKQLLIAY
jgi:hypothetical protein